MEGKFFCLPKYDLGLEWLTSESHGSISEMSERVPLGHCLPALIQTNSPALIGSIS